jgi:hypothetical protein
VPAQRPITEIAHKILLLLLLVYLKVSFTLEEAKEAERGSRVLALIFL